MKRFLLAVTVAALAACGLFGPPSPKDIAAKPGQSAEKDAHVTVSGTLANGATRYPVTGDGVIVIKPKLALQLNLQVDTNSFLGRIGADIIDVDGKSYSRIGAEDWSIKDDPGTSNQSQTYEYVGEEQGAWHLKVRETDWEEWVRESDGYLVKLSIRQSNGSLLTLTLDRFNTGARVSAP